MTTTNNQTHDRIRALDDRQKSRDKVSIWFGSSENYVHGLKEIIANGTDEVINNFEEGTVTVHLHDDLETITVKDTGRGIPIDGTTDGVKNYELLFRTLFASTKYEDTEQTMTGTNGVGATVLNFTSSKFHVDSYYDNRKHMLRFENGGELIEDLHIQPFKSIPLKEERHGTVVTFKLDPEVYPVHTYVVDEVREIVKRFAISSPKVTLVFKYQDEVTSFHYDNVEDYYGELVGNTSTSPIATLPATMYEDEGERNEVKLVLSTTPDPIQESYLNLTYLAKGGSFNDGVIAGVRNFTNKYCKENKLFPKNVTGFATADIESSISFVFVALSNKVQFENQTKLSTDKDLYKKIAQKHTIQLLEIFKVENPSGLKKFVNHLLEVQKHNTASKKAKQALKKKLSEKVEGIGNRVANLVDSKKHGKEAEIFIAEGQSALGSIVLARDAMFQAAYPLRGKILNCLKADYTTIFKNQIITDLIKVLGCGIQGDKKNKDLETFDIKKLRYGKIIIATDADPDGHQIACLIITMIYRLMPALIEQGFIHIAQTPLYEVKLDNDEMIYFFSEKEKDEKLPSIKGKYVIARCKGLGELMPETMAETAMNPETRNLINVTVEDAKKMVESLEAWMGIDSSSRRSYIAENLHRYVENID
ncbi:toprim domain-containing protein [Priestia megaterium]|uniref:toprim domain-containing protein n=1 Tax=Priestia megaterium TaxID=1404 RepID=UPI000BEE2809|nr:toprim domain-containing protein [Priestia megaterium]PED64046.1 DNA topoisomerase [Priestia megaterium]